MSISKPLLLICLLAMLPVWAIGQTYFPVTATSGTQTVNGYNVTISPDGAPGTVVPASNCGTGPYFVGVNGVASGYIYNFSNPITSARVQVYGLNDGEILYFKVNGSIYSIANAPLAAYAGTCGAVYNVNITNGNLSTQGMPVGSMPQAGVEVTIQPATGFSTFEVYYSTNTGDGCSYNLSFTGGCTNSLITLNHTLCSGATLSLSSTNVTGASYSWTGPNGYFVIGQTPVIPNIQTSQAGTYTISAALGSCIYTANSVVTVNQSPPLPAATSNSPICSGDPLTLSMNAIPGVAYGWRGPTGTGSASQDYTIQNTIAADSGYYVASDTAANHCVSVDSILAVVHQSLPAPSITVYSTVGDTICIGGIVPFNTIVANASTNATYQWKQNGSLIPGPLGNASSYVATTVNDKDTFSCIVTSNFNVCQSINQTESAPVGIRVQATLPPPTVAISVYPPAYVSGDTVTFTSYVVNGGIDLSFQWLKNGNIVPGATTSSWQTSDVSMGDKVSVLVKSSFPCAVPNTGTSNIITLAVPQVAGNTNNLHLYPNPNSGNFTLSGNPGLLTETMLDVTDVTGKTVYQEKLPGTGNSMNKQLDLNVAPGNYILKIQAREGANTIPFTVVK